MAFDDSGSGHVSPDQRQQVPRDGAQGVGKPSDPGCSEIAEASCPTCGNDPGKFMHEKNCPQLRVPQESLEDVLNEAHREIAEVALDMAKLAGQDIHMPIQRRLWAINAKIRTALSVGA